MPYGAATHDRSGAYERASLDQYPAKPIRLASHEPHDQALTTSLDRAPGRGIVLQRRNGPSLVRLTVKIMADRLQHLIAITGNAGAISRLAGRTHRIHTHLVPHCFQCREADGEGWTISSPPHLWASTITA